MTRTNAMSQSSRKPAVAGFFYPAAAEALRRDVAGYLAAVAETGPPPKVLVVPHAGLAYSGPVAATAYARLRDGAAGIRRVVLIGPTHRVAFRGIAVPAVDAFTTPLGAVPIDRAARDAVLGCPGVIRSDRAHEFEHSLEVQLPFLQLVLDDFTLLPLVVGDAPAAQVAEVLDLIWGGPETLVVVSTDLSHFHGYEEARAHDAATARRILALDPGLDGGDACGCMGLNGFLLSARRHGLLARQLDLRNSGDTAGDRSRVVGYGAFCFHEPRRAAA